MKSIILLIALLAFTTARFNGEAFYEGFSKQLNLSQEQNHQFYACGNELGLVLKKYEHKSKNEIQNELLGFLFASDAKHRETLISIQHYLHTALPSCRNFVHSFANHLAHGSRSHDEQWYHSTGSLLRYRLHKHSSLIISSLVRLHDAIKHENSREAGESVGHIVQILSGLHHPHSLYDYAKNYSQPVEVQVMNDDSFIQQTINQALKELGCKGQVTQEQVKEVRVAVQTFVMAYHGVHQQLRHANSTIDREVIVLGALRDLIKVGAVVVEQVKHLLEPHLKDLHLSNQQARRYLRHGIHNYYLNLPYIEHKTVDVAMGVRSHHPVQTGHAIASIIKLIIGQHS